MEFYLISAPRIRRIHRFNSQRDGILQGNLSLKNSLSSVSIPNEMEFYGIAGSFASVLFMFQFPTGWNSTNAKERERARQSAFQFPTGWNSTKMVWD